MRKELIDYIYSKNDLKEFLRNQPTWYRKLTRNPEEIKKFEIASLHFFEKTIPQRVEKLSSNLQMASMMMGMLQGLYSQK
ncbi:YlbE-like family protein [Heyndrickxia oleronia]|uniref:YlbE-like family protein n=1 Tax=Heyndrickxia oleronia TaxID=38875 RepID=A0AAW6SQG3_9BACI|nr:YlbE-like family protein [Heyndrickxia oleronia]MDH5161066.1 YlbE-like family protein [Heyndrickxia oleronia]